MKYFVHRLSCNWSKDNKTHVYIPDIWLITPPTKSDIFRWVVRGVKRRDPYKLYPLQTTPPSFISTPHALYNWLPIFGGLSSYIPVVILPTLIHYRSTNRSTSSSGTFHVPDALWEQSKKAFHSPYIYLWYIGVERFWLSSVPPPPENCLKALQSNLRWNDF